MTNDKLISKLNRIKENLKGFIDDYYDPKYVVTMKRGSYTLEDIIDDYKLCDSLERLEKIIIELQSQ